VRVDKDRAPGGREVRRGCGGGVEVWWWGGGVVVGWRGVLMERGEMFCCGDRAPGGEMMWWVREMRGERE
jgi:hypothetical protein